VAEPPPPPKEPEEAVVATASVRGKVTTADGSALPDVRVTVTSGERSQPVVVENDGRFTVEGAPGDELVIAVEANGFLPLSQPVTLAAGQPAELALELQRRPPSGQLRGFIRSFRGSAVDAEIVVDGSGTELRAKDGRFEVDVTPGTHEVRISAHGYVTQVRRVNVEQDGVTLLNIDLKRAP
jgi:uncharacterized membrane protein